MFGGFGGQPSQPQQGMQPQGQLQPFGGRDPFGEMGGMMHSPFGMLGQRPGAAGGGGLFGSLFGQMDQMMRDMDGMMMGRGGSMQGMAGQGGSSMMMMGSSAGGGGGYSCQTMMFSSAMGADGQMRTERFSSSSVGDVNGQMRETQQAYANSGTGMNKMSLERQMEGRGRKMVKEHSAVTGEERHTDMYKGMSEDQYSQFESDWNGRAVPRLPPHAQGMQQAMLGNGGGHARQAGPYGGPYGGQRAVQQVGPYGGQRVVQQAALPAAPHLQQHAQPQASSSWWR